VGEDGFSARLGGDEFGVFLPSIDNKVQAQAVADRLLDKMSIPVELDGKTVNANGSIGVAVGDANVDTNEMFRNADLAMYRSKSSKKNAAVFFDSKMYETVREAYDVLTDMRRGLHENEFLCHYQPIVDLKTSTTIGLEALVRWEHPTRGLLAPSAFIEVAEESGLITEMGCQVMELACRETAELNRSLDEPLTIHVNLSPIQVQEVGIEDRIPQLLKEIGLDPGLLKLEITESTLFDDFEMAEAVFKCLQDSGVSVALDDFGVGYSSLSYLERFPINLLKLDRSFIQDIGESDRRLHIVETMVQMGRALEMQVVAEGVETAEQAEILRNIGCQFAQGYWFSKPVPIEAVKHCVGQLPKQ
jgi:predicted signal transduction protein with EAL and GGDEF domain